MPVTLSAATSLYCERPDGRVLQPDVTFPVMKDAGFAVLDMSFYEYALHEDDPFCQDTAWQRWADRLADAAARADVRFLQSHAYTCNFLAPDVAGDAELAKRHWKLAMRSLDICQMLGVSVIVTHPGMNAFAQRPIGDAWKKNTEYFRRYADEAGRRGMRTAIENMTSYAGNPDRKFFSDAEEIAAFIDSLGDDRIGVCWDFEHGAILGIDQPAAVRILGKRLYAVHVSDTLTRSYEPFMHELPFTGETDWHRIMGALKETGYSGAFSYETHNFTKKIPDPLIPEALHYARAVGEYLVSLTEG